jgi:hypothetical protein
MANSPQRNHAFIYDRKIASHNKSYVHTAYNDSHAMCWGLVLKWYELRTRQHKEC